MKEKSFKKLALKKQVIMTLTPDQTRNLFGGNDTTATANDTTASSDDTTANSNG